MQWTYLGRSWRSRWEPQTEQPGAVFGTMGSFGCEPATEELRPTGMRIASPKGSPYVRMSSLSVVLSGEGYGPPYRRLIRSRAIRAVVAGFLILVGITLFLATIFQSAYWGLFFALALVSFAIISLIPLIWKRR